MWRIGRKEEDKGTKGTMARMGVRNVDRHSLTPKAKPYLKSQFCSYSRASQYFMEPKGSLLCSQEPSTDPYPEPDQSNPYHPILSRIYLNNVHRPTSWSSQWFLPFWISYQYPICILLLLLLLLLLLHLCYMPCPPHLLDSIILTAASNFR
jgi:hypothetical protein